MKGGEGLNKKHDSLTAREKLFCSYYVNSGNYKEAALLAGFRQPEKAASSLIMRDDINEMIRKIYDARTESCRRKARAGYERLAFGSISDAVKLMFENDIPDGNFDAYDLFNVAEIKRPKDGALEIKFFDRIKALEKLECSDDTKKNNVSEFYSALVGGISRIKENVQDGDDNA